MADILREHFETVIGLEVHLQFNTASKIFCACENTFGREPNTCVCPVCLGLPGSLPVLNRNALQYAVKTALALHCDIHRYIKFDRKNYFYPDLPKGYQISQYDFPIGHNGYVSVENSDGIKEIGVHRAHLEEDAGKLIHDTETNVSLVDYNRTGTPLMEIVSEPDIRSPQEAHNYLTALKLILQYLKVSDCDMEKGSLRCDANISLRRAGETRLGTKAEIKNLNSFRAVKSALEFEEQRQFTVLAAGKTVIQETRLWDEAKQATFNMRTKEEAHDYRYFPEPDLVPFTLKSEEIEKIRGTLPEAPIIKFERFKKDYRLSEYDAGVLIQDPDFADFFETCADLFNNPKKICNWMTGPLLKELNERNARITDIDLAPQEFTRLIEQVENGTLSNLAGKDVLPLLFQADASVDIIIKEKGLAQISDRSQIDELIGDLVKEHAHVVEQIREGNHGAIGFLVGQAMKKTQGKANPKLIKEELQRRILDA
ncbi:MAG: Asp-tRNA(Asn)/Glu-tRNA(Gln) amidotransferase subunit GatB [Candidatus Omnitrophota bacterium]